MISRKIMCKNCINDKNEGDMMLAKKKKKEERKKKLQKIKKNL